MARHDVNIDGMDFMLLRSGRGRGVEGTEVPEIENERFVSEDVPILQDTFHTGGFYSQRIIPGTYDYAQNAWALNPRMVCAGPEMNGLTLSDSTAPIRAAADYTFAGNPRVYLVGGTNVYTVLTSTLTSTTKNATVAFASSCSAVSAASFLGDLYIGSLNSTNGNSDVMVINDVPGGGGGIFTSSVPRGYLTTTFYSTATGASPRWLAGQSSASKVDFAAADPSQSSNWGVEVSIRETGSIKINGLVSRNDHTYISTNRGLFDFDGATGNTLNLTPEVEKLLDDDNGIATLSHNGFIYYGHRRGLLRYQTFGQDQGKVLNVTPGYGTTSDNPVRGKVTALTSWGPWILAAVYNGTDTYVCFGRDLQAGEASVGPSPMLWHPGVVYLPSATCYLLFVSALTTPPILWVGNNNSVKWGYLPRTENPLQDGDFRFAPSFKFFTGTNDWGYPSVQKDISQWDAEIDNVGVSGTTMGVNLSQDGGAYGLLGTARTSPRTTLSPSQTTRATRFAERWDGTSGVNTASPVVRGRTLRADVLVRARERRRYSLRLAEWSTDNAGGRMPADVGKMLRRLRALPDRGAISMRDEFGENLTVRVHRPINYQELEVAVDDRRKARVLVVPLEVSVLRRIGTGFEWGDGTRWDGVHVWS